MAEYHNYIAVIGRIPFDEEDTLLLYEHKSYEEAVETFERDMYADVFDAETERESHIKRDGCAVYINHVLTSMTPIVEN